MAVTRADNVVELSDFSQGFKPDLQQEALDPKALADVLNLLPDVGTATPQTRLGFQRITDTLTDEVGDDITAYTVEALHPFTYHHQAAYDTTVDPPTLGTDQTHYLIAVLGNHEDQSPNNIIVLALDLDASPVSCTRIDSDPSREWRYGDADHWGKVVDNVFYGGGRGDLMYAWDPSKPASEQWDPEVSQPDFGTLLESWGGNGNDLGTNEVQTVTMPPGSGYIKLRFRPKNKGKWQDSDPIYRTDNAAAVANALTYNKNNKRGCKDIRSTDIDVTAIGTGAWSIEFQGRYARKDMPMFHVDEVGFSPDDSDEETEIVESTKGETFYASDYAFRARQQVIWETDGAAYMVDDRTQKQDKGDDSKAPTGDLRFKKWEADKHYKKHAKVTFTHDWTTSGPAVEYPRSFECRKDHRSKAADNRPDRTPTAAEEQQRVTVRASRGTFRLKMDGYGTSDRIEVDPQDPTPDATLATGLDTLSADWPDVVPVAEDTGVEITVDYAEDDAPQNEIQRIRTRGKEGRFRLHLDKYGTSDPIDITETVVDTWAAAIENIDGVDEVEVTDTTDDEENLGKNTEYRLSMDAERSRFRLKIDGFDTTAPILWELGSESVDLAQDVEDEINALGPGTVTVTDETMSGVTAEMRLSLSSLEDLRYKLKFRDRSGYWLDGATQNELLSGANTAGDIQEYLENIDGIGAGNVTVSNGPVVVTQVMEYTVTVDHTTIGGAANWLLYGYAGRLGTEPTQVGDSNWDAHLSAAEANAMERSLANLWGIDSAHITVTPDDPAPVGAVHTHTIKVAAAAGFTQPPRLLAIPTEGANAVDSADVGLTNTTQTYVNMFDVAFGGALAERKVPLLEARVFPKDSPNSVDVSWLTEGKSGLPGCRIVFDEGDWALRNIDMTIVANERNEGTGSLDKVIAGKQPNRAFDIEFLGNLSQHPMPQFEVKGFDEDAGFVKVETKQQGKEPGNTFIVTWPTGDYTNYPLLEVKDAHLKGGKETVDISKKTDGCDGTSKFWKPLVLEAPRDEDGEVSKDWNLIQTAPQTNIAEWHANRMWMRYDDQSDAGNAVLAYSAPSKPQLYDDVGEFMWEPKKWQIGNNDQGVQGGFQPFKGEDDITGLHSYGQFLVVFKRRSTWVISGWSEETWTIRRLDGKHGAVGPRAFTELGGLVYFLSDSGFYYTDGTQVQEVPGGEAIREWLRGTINWDAQSDALAEQPNVTLFTWQGYVWIAVPRDGVPNLTVVYDAATESFWPTNLAISAQATQSLSTNVTQLFFARPTLVDTTYAYDSITNATTSPGQVIARVTGADISNLFVQGDFEPIHRADGASVVQDGTQHSHHKPADQAREDSPWLETTPKHTRLTYSHDAAYRGRWGGLVYNKRQPHNRKNYWDWCADVDHGGKGQGEQESPSPGHYHNNFPEVGNVNVPSSYHVPFEGIYQSFAETAETYTISCYARRPAWRKRKKVSFATFRFFVGDSPESTYTGGTFDPEDDPNASNRQNGDQNVLPKADHTYRYVGHGWYKVSATFTGSATARSHGCLISPDTRYQVDNFFCGIGEVEDDDGGGGGGYLDGEYPLVFQYGKATSEDMLYMDDDNLGDTSSANTPVSWLLRTSWIHFGVLREERRIRRQWALIQTPNAVTLRGYMNYREDPVWAITEEPETQDRALHFEGKWRADDSTFTDAHAIQMAAEGDGQAAIIGVAYQTEPRWIRYGKNPEFVRAE